MKRFLPALIGLVIGIAAGLMWKPYAALAVPDDTIGIYLVRYNRITGHTVIFMPQAGATWTAIREP